LREIVENDVYLARLQTSLTHRIKYLDKHGMTSAVLVVEVLRARIIEVRESYRREMESAALQTPIVYSAMGVKGIGARSFLRLAIYIRIDRAASPASLWRYCGLGITRGLVDTVATVKWPGMIKYNEKARRALNDIRMHLMWKSSPYRPLYDAYRQREIDRGVPRQRAHLRASRYMMKQWLKHLWRVWRRSVGLPTGNPHADDDSLTSVYGWR
jgi:hypothetical protein